MKDYIISSTLVKYIRIRRLFEELFYYLSSWQAFEKTLVRPCEADFAPCSFSLVRQRTLADTVPAQRNKAFLKTCQPERTPDLKRISESGFGLRHIRKISAKVCKGLRRDSIT
jgi:hypothetical protein